MAVRALAGEVFTDLAGVSSEIDAALAGVEMPKDDIGDIDAIAPLSAEEIVTGPGNDLFSAVPYAPLNEPVIEDEKAVRTMDTPSPVEPITETPAFDAGHHNRISRLAHEKYPAVPEDPTDDSPTLFNHTEEVTASAACSPVSRDDRPRDATPKQPKRRKGR